MTQFSETEEGKRLYRFWNMSGTTIEALIEECFKAGQESKIIPSHVKSDDAARVADEMVKQARKEVFEKVGNLWELHYSHVFKGGGGNSLQCMTRFNEELEAMQKEMK